jgi:DNA repair protein RadD
MEKANSILYKLLDKKVASSHLEKILGRSLYSGLINYQKYSSNSTIDLPDLLLRSLGFSSIFNSKFQNFLITTILLDNQIAELSILLKVKFTTAFATREELLKKSRTKIGEALIELLGLARNEFIEKESESEITAEEILIYPDPDRFLSLHDYQKKIKDKIVKNLLEKPNARMLVHMPTGSGKTKTCVEAIIDFIRTRQFDEGLVIWFAHTTELCVQSYETLVDAWKIKGDYPMPVFRIFGENDAVDEILDYKKGVIFVGFQKFQSLLRSKNALLIKFRTHLSTNAQLVVIDEAHKSLANTYEQAIKYVSGMPNCRVIGLTATPGRSSDVNDPSNSFLSDFFDDNIIKIEDENGIEIENPLSYLQEKKVLAKIDHNPMQVNLEEFSELEVMKIIASGELDEGQIEKVVESPIRNKIIVDQIYNCLKDPKRDLILVFACTTNHCILIQKLLEFQNIKSEVILSGTPSHLRKKYIADFKNGDLKVLINFGVLTTGFDAPKLKTLILARHTSSIILYSQMVGRALRGPKNGGNELNYIVDLVDNFSKLGNPDELFTYWEEFWGRKFSNTND